MTDAARSRIEEHIQSGEHFVRISVIPGGCSGMTYDATVDTVMGEDDEVIMADGAIKVVSDARSSLFLDGLTIDYSNDLIQAGFRLSNNNASESCGCGASFAV